MTATQDALARVRKGGAWAVVIEGPGAADAARDLVAWARRQRWQIAAALTEALTEEQWPPRGTPTAVHVRGDLAGLAEAVHLLGVRRLLPAPVALIVEMPPDLAPHSEFLIAELRAAPEVTVATAVGRSHKPSSATPNKTWFAEMVRNVEAAAAPTALEILTAAKRRAKRHYRSRLCRIIADLRDDILDAQGADADDPRRGPSLELRARHVIATLPTDEARPALVAAAERAEAAGWTHALTPIILLLASMEIDAGNLDRADALSARAERLAEGLEDATISCGLIHSRIRRARGNPAAAEDRLKILRKHALSTGSRDSLGIVVATEAAMLYRAGRLHDALHTLQGAFDDLRAEGNQNSLCNALRLHGFLLAYTGDEEGGRRAMAEGLVIAAAMERAGEVSEFHNGLAEFHRRHGDLDAAAASYQLAVRLRPGALHVHLNLAIIDLARGNYESARSELRRIRELFSEQGAYGWEAITSCLELPVDEHFGDYSGWETSFVRARKIEEYARVEVDIARSLSMAGASAQEKNGTKASSRAVRAWSLALWSWEMMSQDEEAEAARQALRQLSLSGAAAPVGPFDLVAPIGRGAMGQVWRAIHRVSGAEVAVKVITAKGFRRRSIRGAFYDEVHAMAGLDHPNIAVVLDHGTVGSAADAMTDGALVADSPYVAMELATGGTLTERCGLLSWRQSREVLLALLGALAHAHARGVTHRDLKPDNVLIAHDGPLREAIRLTDFGLAHVAERTSAPRFKIAGTPAYMAPEQFRGETRDFGPWTDLYALGCLAIHLVQGEPPFQGSVTTLQDAQVNEAPPLIRAGASAPTGFEAWATRLLQKDPAHRFQRAIEARRALLVLDDRVTDRGVRFRPEPEQGVTMLPGDFDDTAYPPAHQVGWAVRPADVPPAWVPDRAEETERQTTHTFRTAGLRLFGVREPRIVGQHDARDILWRTLREAHDTARPKAVLLEGPHGVGRSRLCAWLARTAHAFAAARVIPVIADGQGSAIARALQRWFRLDGLEDSAAAARLNRRLAGLTKHEIDAIIHPEKQSAADREEALLRVLERIVLERPLVLTMDDTDPASTRFAAYTLDNLEVAVMIVLTASTEVGEPSPAELLPQDQVAVVRLESLSSAESIELLEEELGLSPTLASQVAERTEGNPLFAVRMIGAWVQRELLISSTAGLELLEDVTAPLASDLAATFGRQIDGVLDGLSADAVAALECAAVLGREVDASEWRAACAQEAIAIPPELEDRLLVNGIVQPAGDGWRFANGLARETLLARAEDSGTIASHHRACAAALLGLPNAQDQWRRGRHLVEAGEHSSAEPVLRDAADRASATRDHWLVLDVLADNARCLTGMTAPDTDPRFGALMTRRAKVNHTMGRFAEAMKWADEVVQTGTGRPDWLPFCGTARELRALILAEYNRLDEAEAELDRAWTTFEEAGDDLGTARCDRVGGMLAMYRRDLVQAERLFRRALDRMIVAGQDKSAANVVYQLASVMEQQGRTAEAEAQYGQALQAFRTQKNGHGQAAVLQALGRMSGRAGRLEEAEAQLRESFELYQEFGPGGAIYAQYALALIRLYQEDLVESEALLRAAAAGAESQGRARELAAMRASLLFAAPDQDWQATYDAARTALDDIESDDDDTALFVEEAARRATDPHRRRMLWFLAETLHRRGKRTEQAENARRQASDLRQR